jgi:hypothetical protein
MANPLTVVLDLKPGIGVAQVRELIDKYQPSIDEGLERAGTVHNARFVLFDASSPNLLPTDGSRGPFKISVITAYDGDFGPYIRDFVTYISDIFDALLPVVVGGESLVPVARHVVEFTAFLAENDAAQHPPNSGFRLYNAYPNTVQQIKAALAKTGSSR